MVLRILVVVHRWVGVALCVILLLWFLSGIGMMYWTFPSVSARDRLERAPALDPATIVLSPGEAATRAGLDPQPAQVRLNTFDGRPVYRFAGVGRGGGRMIYADTGEEQATASRPMRDRIAAAWTGQPAIDATVERIVDVDQWTVAGQLRTLRPLWKYAWPNGEQLYIGEAGEVVQYTTSGSRLGAYVSAIPHWFYFTPIRQHQPQWLQFMIWSAGIGTALALVGLVIAIWRYSPSKRYRIDGAPSRFPYRGQKRWHTILGLVFGVAAATWAFSGMLSLDPFPRPAPQAGAGGRGGGPGVAASLRGRVDMTAFEAVHPREIVARNAALGMRELEFTSFAGDPLFAANLADGTTRMTGLDGTPIPELDRARIVEVVTRAAPEPAAVETSVITQYDWYYRDRTRQRPLPVLLAQFHDERKTRYYIDPATARVVGGYNTDNWTGRWLYNGLHSLDFPWLYNHRPLWDVVVILFMLGGAALCVTSLVLAWRAVGRTFQRALTRPPVRRPVSYAAAPSRQLTRTNGP
jgi:hypothetical protein